MFNEMDLMDMALQSGSVEMIDMILRCGFDINGLNPIGIPYLTVAIENDSEEVVDFLFEKGVDYWVFSEPERRSALWFCSSLYKSNITGMESRRACQVLLNRVRKRDGKQAMIRYMNHRDDRGQTALHFYCQNGDYDLVLEALLNGCADPTIEDDYLKRPQDLAESENIKKLFLRFHRFGQKISHNTLVTDFIQI